MLSSRRGLCSISVGCTHHPHTMEPRPETARVRGTCGSLRRRPHVQVLFLLFSSCPACCVPLLKAHAFPQSYQETEEVRTLLLFLVAAGAVGHYRLRLLGETRRKLRKTLSRRRKRTRRAEPRIRRKGESAATVFGEMPHRSPRLTGGLIGWFQASSLVTQSYAVSTPVFGPMESRLLGTLVKSKSNERGFLGSPLSCGHFLGLQLLNTISWSFLYRLTSWDLRSMRLC